MGKRILCNLTIVGDERNLQFFIERHILHGDLDFNSIIRVSGASSASRIGSEPPADPTTIFAREEESWGGHIVRYSTKLQHDTDDATLKVEYAMIGHSPEMIAAAIARAYPALEIHHEFHIISASHVRQYKMGKPVPIPPEPVILTPQTESSPWHYQMHVSGDILSVMDFSVPFNTRGTFDFRVVLPDAADPDHSAIAASRKDLANRLRQDTIIQKAWMERGDCFSILFDSSELFPLAMMDALSKSYPGLLFGIQASNGTQTYEERWKEGWLHYYKASF